MKKYCVRLSADLFYLTNSVDPDEMQHFIWVFTVCKSICLGVSQIQRVNIFCVYNFFYFFPSVKTYVLGAQMNFLDETVFLVPTIYGRKLFLIKHSYLEPDL